MAGSRALDCGNKKPRSVCSGVAEVKPSTRPRSPGGNDHVRAHSLRDANRDRKNEGGGERLHRGKSMNRGHCNITRGPARQPRGQGCQGCQGCQHCQGCQDCNTAKAAKRGPGEISGNVGSLGSLLDFKAFSRRRLEALVPGIAICAASSPDQPLPGRLVLLQVLGPLGHVGVRLADLDQGVAVVVRLAEQLEQLAVGVRPLRVVVELVDVARLDDTASAARTTRRPTCSPRPAGSSSSSRRPTCARRRP